MITADKKNKILEGIEGLVKVNEQVDVMHETPMNANFLIIVDEDEEDIFDCIEETTTKKGYNLIRVSPSCEEIKNSRYGMTPDNEPVALIPESDVIDAWNKPNSILYFENLINLENSVFRARICNFLNNHLVFDDRQETGIKRLKNIETAVIIAREPINSSAFNITVNDLKFIERIDLRRKK